MRTRIVLLLLVLVLVAAGAFWWSERASAERLHAQLDSLHEQQRALHALQAEQLRLAQSLASVKAVSAERDRLRKSVPVVAPVPAPAPFTVGEWMPSVSWSNSGQATPRAALETALWAAAGGDVIAMQSVIELDPAAQSKAEKMLDGLSPAARSSYVTAEALIASVTMKNIPLTAAQISWYNESDPDHAAVGVLFGNPSLPPETVTTIPANPRDNSPPTLSDNRTSQIALLALHRSSSGWRLVVPVSAIDRIVAELGAPRK
ncbi:MAG: hypothetical protein ABIS43_18990 [Opitutus sp.]